jgi:hypothetical protein
LLFKTPAKLTQRSPMKVLSPMLRERISKVSPGPSGLYPIPW